MRVRLPHKSKPNNYTESCVINETDGWRERLINSGFYDLATAYQSVHVNY